MSRSDIPDGNAPEPQNPATSHGFFESLVVLILLPGVSLGVLWFWALPWHGIDRAAIKIPILISLAAASALLLLASKYPALLYGGKFGFPSPVAAPLVHASFMALVSALSTTAPIGIQRAPDALQPATVWLDLRALGLSMAVQAVLLVLLSPALQRSHGPPAEDR